MTSVYIRVGRNPVSEVYHDDNFDYEIGKAKIMHDGDDLSIVAYGEMVRVALDAAIQLELQGIQARVINMHTIKPDYAQLEYKLVHGNQPIYSSFFLFHKDQPER